MGKTLNIMENNNAEMSIFAYTKNNKMKSFFLNVLAGLTLFFAPITGLIVVVGLVIMFDTFTGIYKSVKLKGWCSIRSRKLSQIISKLVLYELSVLVLFPIDKFLLNEFFLSFVSIQFFATKLVCIFLIVVEVTSIKENIEEALNIDILKAVKRFLSRAKEISNDVDDIKN
jgi:hypothetical protein